MQVIGEMYETEAGQLLFRFFFCKMIRGAVIIWQPYSMFTAAILTIACNVPMAAVTIHPEGVIFW